MSRQSEFSGIHGGSLSRRYARALIGLVQEDQVGNLLERFGADLESIRSAMTQYPDAFDTLANDFLPQSERRSAMEAIATKLGLQEQIRSFLMILVDRERVHILPGIVREFIKMSDGILGILRVQVAAPSQPDAARLRQVEKILSHQTGKTVLASGEARPDMIGGLLLKMEGRMYDGSVKRDLERLMNNMMKG